MNTPDFPKNEKSRLYKLRELNILDTEPEERFDRLTRMAKRMFDVPIALVSLVDANRQWFKSCIGLDARETPREISFCGHAILGDEPFIITDAHEDHRFADNPLVTGQPYIRFYAGCPLELPRGHKLGTLCIIDSKPREMDHDDLTLLKDLARMAEKEILAYHLATIDDLTSISNRRGFLMIAEKSLNLCKRNNRGATLTYFDLDNFKKINDVFGHDEGDKALQVFASLMRENFRDSDCFGRLGGDEFVVLYTGATKHCTNLAIARLQEAVETFNNSRPGGYVIAFSHGIIEYDPSKHTTLDSLMAEGDALMYENKRRRARPATESH
jgi:diguanylate cyclase (GGDEF)-like protein